MSSRPSFPPSISFPSRSFSTSISASDRSSAHLLSYCSFFGFFALEMAGVGEGRSVELTQSLALPPPSLHVSRPLIRFASSIPARAITALPVHRHDPVKFHSRSSLGSLVSVIWSEEAKGGKREERRRIELSTSPFLALVRARADLRL